MHLKQIGFKCIRMHQILTRKSIWNEQSIAARKSSSFVLNWRKQITKLFWKRIISSDFWSFFIFATNEKRFPISWSFSFFSNHRNDRQSKNTNTLDLCLSLAYSLSQSKNTCYAVSLFSIKTVWIGVNVCVTYKYNICHLFTPIHIRIPKWISFIQSHPAKCHINWM